MAQHFLLSAKARSLRLATVLRMGDQEAEKLFASLRWTETNGKAVCPACGCPICYECRRAGGALRFRCKACRHDFSLTSGTLFAHHKLPLQTYLAAVAIFCNEVKGKSALALSRDLDVQYKTAFVLAHKIREALASEMKGARLGGEGKSVEVDGAYFGGYVKPANHKENRRDRRKAENQTGKRQCVIVMRERDGQTLPAAFPSEGAAISFIRSRIAKDTEVHADESSGWDALHAHYVMKRINHTAWTAPARTGRSPSSRGCAGPRSGTTIICRASISPATPRRARGARTIAGRATASRCGGLSGWRWRRGRA